VIDEAGCVDTACCYVPIFHGPLVPSAFTPKRHPNNSWLMVLGGNFESIDFRVYNSWGEEIFFTDDPSSLGWMVNIKVCLNPIGVIRLRPQK